MTKARKTWRKLHICVDENGEILSSSLTTHLESDASQVAPLLKNIVGSIATYLADGGYDQEVTYQAIEDHQRLWNQGFTPKIVIPPNTGFHKEKNTDPQERLENIRVIQDKGKQKWQNITRYGRRSRVENTIYRYKSILGNKLKSKTFHNQKTEVHIGVSILNRMAALGMPSAQRSR